MKRLRLQTNVLIVTVTIFCCCHSSTVNAEEAGVQSNTTTEQTLSPALAASRNVIAAAEDTEQSVELPVTPTPQPPLIDAQPEPSYEPATIDNTAVEKTGQATEQVIEQTIELTPQPPLIDAQQTSTEPDNINEPVIEESPQQVTDETEQATEWSDLRPYRVDADWVQLKSGEWLRGRIIAMQDYRLEFYSDELKKLTIKWRNVKYIKTSAPYRLRFEDQTRVVGAIEITPEEVHVITDYENQTFDRNRLLTIASGKETEGSLWTYNITASYVDGAIEARFVTLMDAHVWQSLCAQALGLGR